VLLLLGAAAAAGERPKLVVQPDAHQTLVNPMCSHCRDEAKRRAGELRQGDRVLCWTRGYSDGGAIPFRFFLNPYRVISDTYGVFVYDPDAGYARGFAPSLDFRFHGWRNGVMVMKHKDGTLYSCLSGLAFDGPRKGDRLRPVPTLVCDWGFWLEHYPQAVAYHMFDKYRPVELSDKGSAGSRKSRGRADDRLPADTLVLGVYEDGKATAYPLPLKRRAWLHAEKDRVLLWQGSTRTAAAYRPLAEPPGKDGGKPRPVTLQLIEADGGPVWRDRETSSTWDIAGRAVTGELKGWTLQWLDSTQVRWFAWAAEYPETAVARP
jgi:hypothetical protein